MLSSLPIPAIASFFPGTDADTSKMVQCIQYSQRSVLGDEEWRTTPCSSIVDHEQSLYDIGIDIGGLLEDIKALQKESNRSSIPNTSSYTDIEKLIHDIVNLDHALESWWDRLKAWVPGPIYWQERQQTFEENLVPTAAESINPAHGEPDFAFSDLRLAHLSMDFWALHLMVSLILCRTLTALASDVKSSTWIQPFIALASRHDEKYRFSLGRNILRSINFTKRPEMGFVGPQKSIFALRIVLTIARDLAGLDAAAMVNEAVSRLRAINTDLGIRFVEDLENNCGDWD